MTSRSLPAPPWAVVLAGALSLAAAMGIGRFAFTPLLPLMAREGQLDVALGGWLAAANYAGYLAGALTAARMPWTAPTLARVALAATAALTAAMAWPGVAPWLVLRFLAGAASAWVFVATSVWCLGTLARRERQQLGAWVYAGVGCGIALTGLYCLVGAASGWPAATLWLHLGALALLLMVPVVWVLVRLEPAAGPAQAPSATPTQGDGAMRGLVVCYGLMGFGYILPATFLPALARGVVDDPRLFGLAWPLFGATAALSTLLASWVQRHASRLQVWAACQFAMGVGVLLPSLWLNGATIAASALLVGGTFMVITLAGVQEMRARAPAQAALWVGRITAAFAAGQIAGPATSALLVPRWGAQGLDLALQAGALALFGSAVWLWRRTLQKTATQETANA
ncbi:YbfB/YjiJ family MFS transporter [Caenimonas sedimenti]|uniref:YbfB/YjiJ family MFS transporter n=1 Tax=Caenimonas sedimenti TaxID=2596921 RepID=A0A562ZQZ8_9BURK|nr:YbfB/YjiJ family MFS transporter [Caenimonas sedimenti]TWO70973.1 YbfB/YjiJ family MFS transporter [Caenimonas sedimenti]